MTGDLREADINLLRLLWFPWQQDRMRGNMGCGMSASIVSSLQAFTHKNSREEENTLRYLSVLLFG